MSSELHYAPTQPRPFNKQCAAVNTVFICHGPSPVIPPNTHTRRKFCKYVSQIADVGSCLINSCPNKTPFDYFYHTSRKPPPASLRAQWGGGRGQSAPSDPQCSAVALRSRLSPNTSKQGAPKTLVVQILWHKFKSQVSPYIHPVHPGMPFACLGSRSASFQPD